MISSLVVISVVHTRSASPRLGSSGTVVGDSTIVCAGGKTYVLTGAKCEAWTELFDDWKSEPADCKIEGQIEGKGDARAFVVDGQSIPFLGPNSLGTDQMKANAAQWHSDFEAAKAALASAP